MHKVLEDYLMILQGIFFHIVERIKEMVLNQYSRYQKDIATACYTIKFQYKQIVLHFLLLEIHRIITPTAI